MVIAVVASGHDWLTKVDFHGGAWPHWPKSSAAALSRSQQPESPAAVMPFCVWRNCARASHCPPDQA